VRRSGEVWVWQRQRGDFPSEIQPRISSQRKRPPNLFGGGGRGRRGENFAQGGGSGVRRNRRATARQFGRRTSLSAGRRERWGRGAGLGRFDRSRPEPVQGQPAGWAGLSRWAKAHLYFWTKFQIPNSNLKIWFKFKLKSILLNLNDLN
jgi:hypothetical protein